MEQLMSTLKFSFPCIKFLVDALLPLPLLHSVGAKRLNEFLSVKLY